MAAADNLGGALRCAVKLAETADVLAEQGKLAEAEELQDCVTDWLLEASQRVSSKEHPETLDIARNLVATHQMQGSD